MFVMFLNYETTSGLIALIVLLMAYCLVVTVPHVFKAWVARKLGDPTATQQGFSSWNPLDHADFVGVICLLLLGLGWGRNVPVTREYIKGPWRTPKIILAYFSDLFAYIALGVIAILVLTLVSGGFTVYHGSHTFLSDLLNYQRLQEIHPSLSSTRVAIALIALSTLFMTVLLGSIQVVINAINYLVDRYYQQIMMSDIPSFVWWVAPMLIMMVSVGFVRWAMIFIMIKLCALGAQCLAFF